MFDDSVQVRCRRCKGVFREREQTIRRAMRAAKQVRAALCEAELELPRRKRLLRGQRSSGERGSYEMSEG